MKKNSIWQGLKDTWIRYCDWVGYVRDYKEHLQNEEEKDNIAFTLNKKIEKLERELKETKERSKIKDDLLEKANIRIASLKLKLSKLMKERKQKNG